jgi:hypothetical protein
MACLEHIRLAGYENVYYSSKAQDGVGEAVHSAWGPATSDRVIGFTMNQRVRPLVFAKLDEFLRNQACHIRSTRWVAEARTFIWENGKPMAEKGYNDDLMSATAQGCWLRDTFIMPGEMSANVDRKLLEGMKVFGHVNTEVKGMSKDPNFVSQATMGIFTSANPAPLQIRLPGGRPKVVDLRWLYK